MADEHPRSVRIVSRSADFSAPNPFVPKAIEKLYYEWRKYAIKTVENYYEQDVLREKYATLVESGEMHRDFQLEKAKVWQFPATVIADQAAEGIDLHARWSSMRARHCLSQLVGETLTNWVFPFSNGLKNHHEVGVFVIFNWGHS